MIRSKLRAKEGARKKFRAIFSRLGRKVNYQGYSEDTILLVKITDTETNEIITDHAWFSYTKSFEKVKLEEGVVLEFEARIKEYKKGYVNKQLGLNKRILDYKLSHPTKIRVVDARNSQ
jgi:hypothetical protein